MNNYFNIFQVKYPKGGKIPGGQIQLERFPKQLQHLFDVHLTGKFHGNPLDTYRAAFVPEKQRWERMGEQEQVSKQSKATTVLKLSFKNLPIDVW